MAARIGPSPGARRCSSSPSSCGCAAISRPPRSRTPESPRGFSRCRNCRSARRRPVPFTTTPAGALAGRTKPASADAVHFEIHAVPLRHGAPNGGACPSRAPPGSRSPGSAAKAPDSDPSGPGSRPERSAPRHKSHENSVNVSNDDAHRCQRESVKQELRLAIRRTAARRRRSIQSADDLGELPRSFAPSSDGEHHQRGVERVRHRRARRDDADRHACSRPALPCEGRGSPDSLDSNACATFC